MSTRHPLPEHDEVLDLMALRAIEGLSEDEEIKLARLLAGSRSDPDELEFAAAAFQAAFLDVDIEEMPEDLRRRVIEDAGGVTKPEARGATSGELRRFPFEWLVAAAAVILAVVAWIPRFESGRTESARERLDRLVAEASDVVRVPWKALDQPGYENVRGEVVWSSTRQEGFMRLAGLPLADAEREQYQLWIVDKDRDAKHPVDGGVFDFRPAREGAEVVIPIRAALDCPSPEVFALTRERRGGVVVSAGPLLVAASVP